MPIILDTVRISGFRGIRNLEMSLPRFAVLIGPNNCGKTSVLKSLQLVLGDYGRQLSDEDFHIDNHDRRTEEIIIDVRIIPTGNGGERVRNFSRRWINKFGDNIQADPSGDQFIAFRTAARRQKTPRAGFLIERHTLRVWSGFADWPSSVPDLSSRYTLNSRSIPFVAIDAQRDIHRELSQKSSFVGRVLSQVEYSEEDVDELERLIAEINSKAVSKSEPLAKLMEHLNALRVSFGGIGGVEVMPVPKKLRDLSKNFSVHFGDSAAGLFPMEYHGMGTRSWASMLAVRAFTELAEELLVEETEPY
ncbi:MAG: AAA family ATPase, partial [Rhodobacteraceae bacterium]|nr:AAA family ATPase [Paracoccaceae bacterium]